MTKIYREGYLSPIMRTVSKRASEVEALFPFSEGIKPRCFAEHLFCQT